MMITAVNPYPVDENTITESNPSIHQPNHPEDHSYQPIEQSDRPIIQ